MKTLTPKGYNTLTPYITIKGAGKAIEFYQKVFGARETGRISMPDGTIGHCELQFGDSKLMMAEENERWGNVSPLKLGGSAVCLSLYVDNVDAVFETAIREGAKVSGGMEPKDQFYGDRTATITDPFGHIWTIMTHIEDISFQEMQKRSDALFK